MAKAAKKPPEAEIQFELYVDEVIEIAERVMRAHDRVRSREVIRHEVEKYVGQAGVCAGLPTNRRQVVERGLAVGVTKMLEAWDFVQTSRAWPAQEAA